MTAHRFIGPDVKVRSGPSGLHMFNRTSGWNVLFDELRVPRAQWALAPRQISIALTNACDLSCPYCYAPKNGAALDLETVGSWLLDLDANGCLGVGFGGGEPTLYPHLSDLCAYVVRHTGLAVTFTTHAHWIDDALAERLEGNVHFLRVSMDGVGPTYEALRRRSFASLQCHIEVISRLAPFGINFVVNSHTLPDLNAATDLAAELGAKEFLLLPERPVRGRGGIDSITTQQLKAWVSHYSGSIPLTISEADSEGLPASPIVANETGLRAYAHIDATGFLRQSSYAETGVQIGRDGVMTALQLLETHCVEELT
jgi:sulfatase maturation enzyme AslB (radical SAM superfamily)